MTDGHPQNSKCFSFIHRPTGWLKFSRSTSPPTQTDPEKSPARGVSSNAKDVRVAWNFTQMLLERLPEVIDTNPVNITVDIVKIVLQIRDELKGDIDAVDQQIILAVEQLANVDIAEHKQGLTSYQTTLQNEWKNLIELKNLSNINKVAVQEDEKRKIADIFNRIDGARKQLMMVAAIRDDVTKSPARLEQLQPSLKADRRFKPMGEQRRLLRGTVCTAGTRDRLLNDIATWANDTSPESQTVYWLSGRVGSGKTTIAYTIAHRFDTAGGARVDDTITLGGNFFCSRQIDETRSATHIIRTIVYHLAHKCTPFSDALDPSPQFDAINQSVRTQLESLLIKPWNQAQLENPSKPPRFLVVIDALDEIEGTSGSDFLRDVLDITNKHRIPGLKFFVTSQPDPKLVTHLGSFENNQACRLEEVSGAETHGDIITYLNANLPAFVGRPEMENLVTQAAGLFIFAATIVRHLAGRTPLEQKRRLATLPIVSSSKVYQTLEETPFLDSLYMQILSEAFRAYKGDERLERLQILHTFLCTAEYTSTSVVAELLFPSNDEDSDPIFSLASIADDVLAHLHAVLYQENNKVFSYHQSFTDFIFDRSRAKEFACDEAIHHQLLTHSCFFTMGSLKFNITNIASIILDQDNPALSEVVKNIPPVLSYSCRNWDYHLLAFQSFNLVYPFNTILLEFLHLHILFWMEAMNLLDSQSQCEWMLQKAEQWVLNDNLLLKQELSQAASFAKGWLAKKHIV